MLQNKPSTDYKFPDCGNKPLGFYPLVWDFMWVENLGQWGVSTIQLRMKNAPLQDRIDTYKKCISYAKEKNIRLFINDDWELAIEFDAYGIHLGQEDLQTVDIAVIAESGLRLGVSTHNDRDIQYALSLKPSYIACGPIYTTTSKLDAAPPIGIENLRRYCKQITEYPIVAIGGINEERLHDVVDAGVSGVSVIQVLKDAPNPEYFAKKWNELCVKDIRNTNGDIATI